MEASISLGYSNLLQILTHSFGVDPQLLEC